MNLVEISRDGSPAEETGPLPDVARSAIDATVQLYSRAGFSRPWIGFLAFEDGECVGTCAFTHAPRDGAVEIAYFTFPGNEGRGIATRMGERLVSMARESAPGVSVTAHTLPHENASTRILRKLGFGLMGPMLHAEDGQIWLWRHLGGTAGPPPDPSRAGREAEDRRSGPP
jgi:[ribosomal protein S5]-alanine N-acetyltransferase